MRNFLMILAIFFLSCPSMALAQTVTHSIAWPKAGGYVVERSFNRKAWTEVARPAAGATTYTDTFVNDPAWREVCYRMGALTADGSISFGKLQCVTLPPAIKVTPALVKPGATI